MIESISSGTTKTYTSKRVGSIAISTEVQHITIRSERLKLTSLNQHDRDYLIKNFTALLENPNNVAMFREGQPWNETQIIDFVDCEINKWNGNKRFCALAIHHAKTNEFMGSLHIDYELNKYANLGIGHANAAEMGYIIDEAFWRKGYGTEIAVIGKKYIKHIMSVGELDDIENYPEEIVATVHPKNGGSRAILEKTLKHQESEEFTCYGDKPRILFFKSLRPKQTNPPVEYIQNRPTESHR